MRKPLVLLRLTSSSMRLLGRCGILLVCIMLLPAATLFGGSPLTLAELRRDISVGWQHLRDLDRGVKTYDVTIDKKEPGTVRCVSSRKIKIDHPKGYWSVTGNEGDLSVVTARSPTYAFVVGKHIEKDWRVQSLSRTQPEIESFECAMLLGGNPNAFLLYPLSSSFLATPLPDPFKDKAFQITGFKTLADGKLSVKFVWNVVLEEFKKSFICEGKMLVNPKLSFAVEEWDCLATGLGPQPIHSKKSWSYAKKMEGSDDVVCLSIKEEDSGVRHIFHSFDNYDKAKFSYESFRLSYYGLPEPMGMPAVDRRGSRWYLWITLAAIAAVGLAVLFWKLKGRFERPKSPEVTADPKVGRT